MIVWCDGAHDAPANMLRDATLLAAGARADREPVLRLFRFAPPGITLGRSQEPARELDLGRCVRDGVKWAVRPTGGRAIFHAEEWTYSLAAAISHPEWGGTLRRAYERTSWLVLASLRRLGVPAELAPRAERRGAERPRTPAGAAPPCFASIARHEIVLAGRKLVGSAQRRTAHALLQQGSVLLGPGHLRLADYLALPEPSREATRATLAAAAADAGAHLAPDEPLETWAAALMTELGRGGRLLHGPAGEWLLAD